MLAALATPRDRKLTLVFLAICLFAAAAASVVGISDNPPGIALAYVATTALVLAFVHPWRTVRKFGLLFAVSVAGFAACVVLHNLFEGLAGRSANLRALQMPLQGLGVLAFLLAILVCPPATLVGAVGSVVMFIRNLGGSGRGGS